MRSANIGSILRSLTALVVAFLLTSVAAFAHAEFRGSIPEPDVVLDAMPTSVELRFSEDVGPLALSWRLPDGSEREAPVTSAFQTLKVEPPPDGGEGSYALRWRVASTDGHPVSGTLVFSVGHISSTAETAETGSIWLVMATRAAMTSAMMIAVGAVVFGWLIHPIDGTVRRLALWAAAITLPAALVLLAAEGLDRLGLPLSALLSLQTWSEGLRSPTRASVILSLLASTLAALSVHWRSTVAILGAWAMGALSFGVSGHAMSLPIPGVPLTTLHATAQIFWIGGLVPLAASVYGQPGKVQADLLRRFSTFALPAVIVLLLSGSGLILMRNPGWSTLATAWAELLSVKLLLVAVMLALATWHRRYATPRLASGRAAPLRMTLGLEIAIGFVVLALAMGFRIAPPHTSDATDMPGLHLHGKKTMADLSFSGVPPGAINVDIALTRIGTSTQAKELTISFHDPVAGIGPLDSVALQVSSGVWKAGPVTLPTPGPWDVTLTVLVSDFEQEKLGGKWPQTNNTGTE